MKRKRRAKKQRPVREIPDSIPDTPENVAKAILFSPPEKDDEWEYLAPEMEAE